MQKMVEYPEIFVQGVPYKIITTLIEFCLIDFLITRYNFI